MKIKMTDFVDGVWLTALLLTPLGITILIAWQADTAKAHDLELQVPNATSTFYFHDGDNPIQGVLLTQDEVHGIALTLSRHEERIAELENRLLKNMEQQARLAEVRIEINKFLEVLMRIDDETVREEEAIYIDARNSLVGMRTDTPSNDLKIDEEAAK